MYSFVVAVDVDGRVAHAQRLNRRTELCSKSVGGPQRDRRIIGTVKRHKNLFVARWGHFGRFSG